MDNLNSINNNSVPYYFKADIAKEGGQYVRLSNFFKARVGDNGKVLPFKWYDQGRVMNVHGYIPFIQGLIGKFSTDENDEVIMAPDASYREWQGSTANAHDGGFIDYILEDQMFPQEGIFKGHFGLKDGNGNVLTSVNIIFEVLGNDLRVGETVKYYLGDLENLKNQYKAQGEQAVKDFNAKIESGTETDRQALDALRASIQANRDEQKNLLTQILGVKQQISLNEVITRPEFSTLSNQITQQVAQLGNHNIEFFKNIDALKSAYPQGGNGLYITLNDSHEWIYDKINSSWSDVGAFNLGGIDPNLLNGVYTNGTGNLIPNPDFETLDSWRIYRSNNTAANYSIRPGVKYRSSNILRITGYWDNADTENTWTWAESPKFAIDSTQPLLYGAMIDFNSSIPNTGGNAQLQLKFYDSNGTQKGWDVLNLTSKETGQLTYVFRNNIETKGATQVSFVFGIQGGGYLDIAAPRVFESSLNSYSLEELVDILSQADDNALLMQPVHKWIVPVDSESNVFFDSTNKLLKITNNNDQDSTYYQIRSLPINIEENSYYQMIIPANVGFESKGKYYSTLVTVTWLNIDGETISTEDHFLEASSTMVNRSFIVQAPENAYQAYINISLQGSGYIYLHDISFKETTIKNKLELDLNGADFKPKELSNTSFANLSSSINQIESSTQDWQVLETELLPLPQGVKRLSVQAIAQSNIEENGQANVTIQEFSDRAKKQADFTTDLRLSETGDGTYTNISLHSTTNFVKIIIGVSNSQAKIKRIKLKYDSIQDFFVNQVPPSYPTQSEPFYTWSYTSPNVSLDKTGFYQRPAIAINTTNQDVNAWTSISSSIYPKQSYDEIKVKLTYQSDEPSTNGASYLVITQLKNGTVIKNENIQLAGSSNWYTRYISHYKFLSETTDVRFSIAVKGNSNVTLGDLEIEFTQQNGESLLSNVKNDLPQFIIEAPSTNISADWATAPFEWDDGQRVLKGYVKFAIQGNSSRAYPKKNLKLKFFEDAQCNQKMSWKPKASWTKTNKFNAKANWIDATQSRNLANAKIFQKATAVTPFENQEIADRLLDTQSLGQIEGFPIEITFNDGYYGLFTFNTKKTATTFNMSDNNPDHEIVTNENSELSFHVGQTFDPENYGTEIHDEASDALKSNLSALEDFINNSSDEDFKSKIGNYIDVSSVINTYLFGLLSEEWDFQSKSQLLLTWNSGKYFYMVPYDLDSTWGLYWNGSHINTEEERQAFALKEDSTYVSMTNKNLLMKRIFDTMKTRIKSQYSKLRSSVWRNDQIIDTFKQFINSIPQNAIELEQKKWADIPSKDITDLAQIQSEVIKRGNAMDKFMEGLQ